MSPQQRYRDGVREVLVLQYELHEVGHHSVCPDKPVEPLAHGVSDIYKCLHQGAFGVGHDITNEDDFRGRLIEEMMRPQTVSTSTEKLLESLSADGALLRVNLRPLRLLFSGREEEVCRLLVQVCLQSTAIATQSPAEFFFALESFRDLNRSGELRAGGIVFSFSEKVVEAFLREINLLAKSMGAIPVLSHSPAYRKFNNPSYRVVHREALRKSPLAELIRNLRKIESGYVH